MAASGHALEHPPVSRYRVGSVGPPSSPERSAPSCIPALGPPPIHPAAEEPLMAKPKNGKKSRAARRGVCADECGDSWFMILLQMPDQTGPVDLDALMDRLVGSGLVGQSRRDVAAELHAGHIPTPAGKWGLLVSMPGQSWAYLLPGGDEPGLTPEIARRSGPRAILAGYQGTANATYFPRLTRRPPGGVARLPRHSRRFAVRRGPSRPRERPHTKGPGPPLARRAIVQPWSA